MSDPFIVQLSELCSSHVTRAKWVFVPSHAVGSGLTSDVLSQALHEER